MVTSDPSVTERTEPLPEVREMFVKRDEERQTEASDLSEMREEESVKLETTLSTQ